MVALVQAERAIEILNKRNQPPEGSSDFPS